MDKEAADQFVAEFTRRAAEFGKLLGNPLELRMPPEQYEMLRQVHEDHVDRGFARGEWQAVTERVSRVAAAEMFAFSQRRGLS